MNPDPMQAAISAALDGMRNHGGGPFGAVVVKDGEIIGRGNNLVTAKNDPTAHAEIVAIRNACESMKAFQLTGCEIYTTCEPCPMCLGAIYWARPDRVYFACTKEDAAAAGFDDAYIYQEIQTIPANRNIPFIAVPKAFAIELFDEWMNNPDKHEY